MQNQKILVTGSSGTIGTRLVEKLLEKNYEVVGVDKRPNKWHDKINKLTIIGDLRDEETLEKLPKDVDLIIHLAANARVYNLVVDPYLAFDNLKTLFNMLEFCRKNNIKKFLFASSREVYGNSNKSIHTEEDAYVKNCESPYTASKIGGEAIVNSYNQCYGINFVILRFSNVYGMYDESDRIIPLFIKQCKNNQDLFVFGREKILDFTFIDDAIQGIIRSIERFDNVKNQVFNLGSGKGTSLLKIAELTKEFLQKNIKINLKDNRTGEVVKYIADISKARRRLDYVPQTEIREGIKKSIEWFETQSENEEKNLSEN